MKNLTIVLTTIMLLLPSMCLAYLTEKSVKNEPLYGNKAGTHNEFTKYSIANLDFNAGVREKLKTVQDTILKGNSDEDDEIGVKKKGQVSKNQISMVYFEMIEI